MRLNSHFITTNGIKKFSGETLPAKEKFFSKLNDCGISEEDQRESVKNSG